MERSILHIDMNNFFASVECLYDPRLKDVPMAVGGSPESRHGIVLAKNMKAKAYGVQTAEALWQARQKCPNIVFVKPHFDRYKKYSDAARQIYLQYTDQVENFGLDECWLDVTGSRALFGTGEQIAEEIRNRIKDELGLTVSIGVSFNKIFAKLGSDYKKPDAVTVFSKENFRDKIWPIPAGDMLGVGPSTQEKLRKYGIHTIGQIAAMEPDRLGKLFGKMGYVLWQFAMGLDSSPVTCDGYEREIKSIGNSTTTPKDLVTDEDVRITLYVLCESVAERLRENGLSATGVQLELRNTHLERREHQRVVPFPICDSDSLFKTASSLYKEMHNRDPLRSIGVRAIKLTGDEGVQFSLYPEEARSRRRSELERTVDKLRERYGRDSLVRGVFFADPLLSKVNPRKDHTIHPVGFFK